MIATIVGVVCLVLGFFCGVRLGAKAAVHKLETLVAEARKLTQRISS